MPTTDEINDYYNSLSQEAQRKAIESGDLERAISTGDLAPLQQYAPAPAPPPTQEVPPEARITAQPHGGYYAGVYTEDDAFYRYLSAKYRQTFIAPDEGRGLTYSQARSYMANLQPGARGYAATVQSLSKTRQQELEYAAWVASGRPDIYPDTYQGRQVAPPPGSYTTSQWEAQSGVGFASFQPGTKENRATSELPWDKADPFAPPMQLKQEFLEQAGVRPEEVPSYISREEISRALARGEGSGADLGPGVRGETSEESGQRWGRQMGAIGPQGPMGAPPPDPADYVNRDIPQGYLPSDYLPGQAAMAALGQLTPEQRAAAIQSGAARQAYEKGDIGTLNPYAQPHEFDPPPLRGTPAEGFQGKDILMAGGGLATLRGLGEVPTPAMEKAPQPGGPAQPPAMGPYLPAMVKNPFASLGFLGQGVQTAGEKFSSYLGRAGDIWVREVAGIRPLPPPPSQVSVDAKKYMAGGITETEITTVPLIPLEADAEGKLATQTTTVATFRPFVDAEVVVRGDASKTAKETFTEMVEGPKDIFRYPAMDWLPFKLPFKTVPIGINTENIPKKLPEAYSLRAAPGVFTREVGSTIGRGIVAPLGQGISALEHPLQAGMAAPGVALALGLGLTMLPGQIAVASALNPAAGAGQVYGLVAPFSLAGKLRGARVEAKPTADIQFPGYSEGGVLLEVPKRGPIAGHIDLGGVVASRIMGRPVRSTVQVGEGGVFELPVEWVERPRVGGVAVSAEPLLRELAIEKRLQVDLSVGRTAEMQVPGNVAMTGSLRARYKGVSGFQEWLNVKGAEGLEAFQPRRMRVTQDISYAKGELGNVDLGRPTDINIAYEQFPSLRGWEARLDNPQFARAYWEAERAEMIGTIGHEFRHSIQPEYYEWKAKNFAKTKGLMERDAERFAEQARAAWEAEVGPAALERVYGKKNLEPEFGAVAKVKEELVATVPRTPQTVDVFRLGRAGEAEIELFGDYFVPATREGTAYVKGAPKGLFQPIYETVKTAEPWMKGREPLYTGVGLIDYPIVRPQTLLERATRRPAEEIKLVSQKRLLGYEATLSRETSGRLGEFVLGKTSPKGTVIRPKEIRMYTIEPLEGMTPKEIGAEATFGARDAPANLGLTEGAKAGEVFLGGIGARAKATYILKPEQFGQAPKALERFGLKSSLVGGRLEVEFGGVKGAPSLYDTPIGMKAVGGAIKIRPGLAELARGRAGSLMERIKKRGQAPLGIDFPRKVKIPGPGDRRGNIFDYVEADRQELIRGAAASRAGDRSVDLSARGYKVGTGGAKAGSGGLISGGPRGRTAMGVVIERRGNMKLLELVDTESAGSGFRFYSAPGSRMTLRMPRASLEGASLGLATGALGLRGKVGASEVMTQVQKDTSRLLDAMAERPKVGQTLRMPETFKQDRREGIDILQLERDKVTPVVGQFPGIMAGQTSRVTERVGQTERQGTVQTVDEIMRLRDKTDTGGGGGGGGPPPPPPRTPPYWPYRPGYLQGGRGSFKGFRFSLKKNPIATIADISRGIRPPTSLLGRIKGLGLTRGPSGGVYLFKGIGLPKPPKRRGKKKASKRKKGGRRKR